MVQIIGMQPTPSVGAAFGAGIGQGISQGLNYAIQDIMQQKANKRQNSSLVEALGPDTLNSLGMSAKDLDKYSSLDPKLFMGALEFKMQQRSLRDMASARMGSPYGAGSNIGYQEQGGESPGQSLLQQQLSPRTLPAGVAPMLNYEDMPAIEENEAQPRIQPQALRQQPEKEEASYDTKRQQVSDYWDQQINNAPSNMIGKLIDLKEKQLVQLREDEKLKQATEKTDVAKQKLKKELQELPTQVSTRLNKFEDMATRADQSINAIENIDTLLEQGAQLPELVQDINLKLGKDNPLAQFATNLASNPLSKVLETARVQQFSGMKDLFGGNIKLAEFNEFIKKLQDVRDPVLTNKIKGVLLKQFANMEKFPYEGLQKAVEEDRKAPSDVIMKRGKKYADEMAKDYAASAKKQMESLIKSETRKSFDSLPKATSFEGKIATDTKTGKRYKSMNGQWKEIK